MLQIHANGWTANPSLTLADKSILVAGMLSFPLAGAWGFFWFLKCIECIAARVRSRFFRLPAFFVITLILSIAVNTYVTCWVVYIRLKVFPDLDSVVFGCINARMIARYFWQAEPGFCLTFGAIVMCVSIGCTVLLCNATTARMVALSPKLFIRQSIAVVALVNIFTVASRVATPNAASITIADTPDIQCAPVSFELQYHTGPAVTLLFGGQRPARETRNIPLDLLVPRTNRKTTKPVQSQVKNVVVIVIESLRGDAMLKQQDGVVVMPNLVELAQTGRLFPNTYSNSTHSDYSDPCVLSSLFPLRTEVHHYYSAADPWPKVCVYDVLKPIGFATAMFSSQNETWSNMHLFYDSPNLDVLYDSRSFDGPTVIEKGEGFAWWMENTGQLAGKLDDAVTTRQAVRWVTEQQSRQQPFFLSLNFQTSHFPYERPDGLEEPFQPGTLVSGTSVVNYSDSEIPRVRNAYFNALHYVDEQIGSLVSALEQLGIRNETAIVITGDHGEAFFENGSCGHGGEALETVTKVGLVINCPGSIVPTVDDYLAQAVDIAPTLVGLLELELVSAFQGIDLLSQERPPNDERLVFVHTATLLGHFDAVVSGTGWKYQLDHKENKRELYFRPTDLRSVPNLLQQYSAVADILHTALAQWRNNQLGYYGQQRYYNWFHAPKSRSLKAEEIRTMKLAAPQI